MKSTVVLIDPEIMNGTPCFAGTHVPIRAFFDYLEGGHPMAYFFEDFPSVTKAQVTMLLEEAKYRCLAAALYEDTFGRIRSKGIAPTPARPRNQNGSGNEFKISRMTSP